MDLAIPPIAKGCYRVNADTYIDIKDDGSVWIHNDILDVCVNGSRVHVSNFNHKIQELYCQDFRAESGWPNGFIITSKETKA